MKSSYKYNNYHTLFAAIVQITSPKCCVECGVLEGYSTFAIGNALRGVPGGHLFAYDIAIRPIGFEMVKGLPVTLRGGDAFEVWRDFKDGEVDFLHIDISNTGEILRELIGLWNPKIKPGGIFIFEGGSPLRDGVDWMSRYGKEAIHPEVKVNEILRDEYSCVILHHYPSVLLCSKNIDDRASLWVHFGYDNYGKE